jgi:hypothetical protein
MGSLGGLAGSVRAVIVDRAIYRDGRRVAMPRDLEEMAVSCGVDGGIAWIGLVATALVSDGESTWFEGIQLIALCAVIGIIFYAA